MSFIWPTDLVTTRAYIQTMGPFPNDKKRYRVFLSYKHDDNRHEGRLWANWLRNELERYQIPPELIGKKNRHNEEIPPTLAPVFRDEDCLGAVSALDEWIAHGLQRSEALVCLCSPRSARSDWVAKEVRQFKEMGKSDRIQALVIEGQPRASEGEGASEGATPDEECFPIELLRGVPDPVRTIKDGRPAIEWEAKSQPLWADVRPERTRAQGYTSSGAYLEHLQERGDVPLSEIPMRVARYEERLRSAVRSLVAGILCVDLDDLYNREAEQRAREAEQKARKLWKVSAVSIVMTLVLSTLLGVTWNALDRPNHVVSEYMQAISKANWEDAHSLLSPTLSYWSAAEMEQSYQGFRKQTLIAISPTENFQSAILGLLRGRREYTATSIFEVQLGPTDVREPIPPKRADDVNWAKLGVPIKYAELKASLDPKAELVFQTLRTEVFTIERSGLRWGVGKLGKTTSEGFIVTR